MMKNLRIKMPDLSIWQVPAHLIAENRAKYYAERKGKELYLEEYEFTLNDDSILIDWATNNMDWEDVSQYATIIEKPEVDYQEGWINGEHSIIEEE